MRAEDIAAVLEENEEWLMDRILHFALQYGYTPYTSTLAEAWRISIAGLTGALGKGFKLFLQGGGEIEADVDLLKDPVAAFAIEQARRHRSRGVSLGMFLGLFTHYRQAYMDLAAHALPPGQDRDRVVTALLRLFDRMTTAFCVEWAKTGEQGASREMAGTLQAMTNEKNLYLTFFEGMDSPVVLIDAGGRIRNLNRAAARIHDDSVRFGQHYYSAASGLGDKGLIGMDAAEAYPMLAKFIRDFVNGSGSIREVDFMKVVDGHERWFKATLDRMPDVSGKFAGYCLVCHETTRDRMREAAVTRAKVELQRTFDTISDMVFVIDESGTILHANRNMASRLGLEPRDLVGKTCREVLGCTLCSVGGSCCDTDMPVRYENVTGSFLVNRNVLRDSEGVEYGTVHVARDISQIERFREALVAIEGKYKGIFENAPIGIFQSTLEGTYLSVNPEQARIFGFESPEEMQRFYTDIPGQMYVRPQDRQQAIEEGLSFGEISIRDVQLRRRDGSVFWARFRGRVVRDAVGHPLHFEGFVEDVSEYLAAQRELAESESRFRNLLETMDQGLLEVTVMGTVASCNNSMLRILKTNREKFIGRDLASIAHPEDSELLREILAAEMAEDNRHFELRFRSGESYALTLATVVRIKADSGGKARYWFLVLDVTERKMMESKLLQTMKLEAIGQLAAGIAHEINTPTQYVLSNTWFFREALQDLEAAWKGHVAFLAEAEGVPGLAEAVREVRAADEEHQVDYFLAELPAALSETLHGLDRITSIVGSVKQFIHPGHGNTQDADLNRLIESSVSLSQNEWKYVADVTTDLDPCLPLVPCMIDEIGQVLLNLLVNAAHAIVKSLDGRNEEKGRIHLSTHKDGDWAEVRVADSGTGIPAHVRGRIFEPFFTTKPVGQGTGQGLFLAHRCIVGNHKGSLTFETQEGKGTTFIIRLPLMK